MRRNILRVPNAFTLTISPVNSNNQIKTGNPVCLLGNNWVEGVDKDLTGIKLLPTPSDLLRHRSSINDNYCAQFVTGRGSPVFVTGQMDFCVQSVVKNSNCVAVTGQDCFLTKSVETRTQLLVYYPVVTHVPFAGGSSQKKDVIPEHQMPIKSVKGVSCVN